MFVTMNTETQLRSLPNKPGSSTSRLRQCLLIALAVSLVYLTIAGYAFAHPEDEFCSPGDGSGLDPQLCYALNEIDRAGSVRLTGDALGRGVVETAWIYLGIGIRHILPSGTDHILFVLALFLPSTGVKQLALQISFFTLAHTVTVGLTVAGIISPPPEIVEPLIAASIAFVAIENVTFREMTKWRPGIVFGFGLLHGMGFAGALSDSGIPDDHFFSALIGYNLGVEIGQLTTVALAAVTLIVLLARTTSTERPRIKRSFIVIPASIVISSIAVFWTIQRIWF